jgi:hypothetical protein
MPWFPSHVTPQTWRSNGFYKSEGYICLNIEKKLLIPTVYPSKTFAYAKCKELNQQNQQIASFEFEKEEDNDIIYDGNTSKANT